MSTISTSLPHRLPFDRRVGSTSSETLLANCLSANLLQPSSYLSTARVLSSSSDSESIFEAAQQLSLGSLNIPASNTSTGQTAHRLGDYFPISPVVSGVLLGLSSDIDAKSSAATYSQQPGECVDAPATSTARRKKGFKKSKHEDCISKAVKQAEKSISSVLRGPCFVSVMAASEENSNHVGSLGDTPPTSHRPSVIEGLPLLSGGGGNNPLPSTTTPYTVGYTLDRCRVVVNQRSGAPCKDPQVLADWFGTLNTMCCYSGPVEHNPRRNITDQKTSGADTTDSSSLAATSADASFLDMPSALMAQRESKQLLKNAKGQWELTSACRSHFILNATGGVLSAVQSVESNLNEPIVVEAGLQFLYNLLHLNGFKVTKQRIPVGTPSTTCTTSETASTMSTGQQCTPVPPASVTFQKAEGFLQQVPGIARTEEEREYQRIQIAEDVRSEIKHLRSKRPLPYPGTSQIVDQRPRVSIIGFSITSKRDTKVSQKLDKRGISRLLFSIISRYVSTTNSANNITALHVETIKDIFEDCGAIGLTADSASPEDRTRIRCVYLACLLLVAVAGGTKQSEEAWESERRRQARGYALPGGNLEDEEGEEQHGEEEAPKDEDGASTAVEKEDGGDSDDDDGGSKSKKASGAGGDDENEEEPGETAAAGGKAPSTDIGGGYSGPLRGVLGAAAIKVATLGRLSSSVTVLIALLQQLVPLLNSLKDEDVTSTSSVFSSLPNIPQLAENCYRWNHVFEPVEPQIRNKGRHATSPTLKLSGLVGSIYAALCIAAVGDSNVLPMLKRGLLVTCAASLQRPLPTTKNGLNALAHEASIVRRWAAELAFRLLCPTTPDDSGSSSLVWANSVPLPYSNIGLSNSDVSNYIKEPFVQQMDAVNLLLRLVDESLTTLSPPNQPNSMEGAHPCLPLFYCCCDILRLLLNSSSCGAASSPAIKSGILLKVATAVGKLALNDSPDGPSGRPRQQLQQPSQFIPLLVSDWTNLINCISKLHNIVDLPVGLDNDLCWLPPPELVEKLRRQQQIAAEKAAALEAERAAQCETSAGGDSSVGGAAKKRRSSSGDDINDLDTTIAKTVNMVPDDEDPSNIEGLSELFPEMNLTSESTSNSNGNPVWTFPSVPPSTSILGVSSVHHVKPFSEPRPMPSSSSAINSYPKLIEPLLVQSTKQRAQVIKRQLARFLFPEIVKHVAVYDDLPRSVANIPKIVLPKLPPPSSSTHRVDTTLTTIALKKALLLQHNTSSTSSGGDEGSSIPPLRFASNFECGNLKRAIQVLPTEYDLILHTDVNTNGFTQWFYFRVDGAVPGVPYRFNILNMEKTSSTFNDGQRPLLFSENRFQSTQQNEGWMRAGSDIYYFKNSLQKKGREAAKSALTVPMDATGDDATSSSNATATTNTFSASQEVTDGSKLTSSRGTSVGGVTRATSGVGATRKKPGSSSMQKPSTAAASSSSLGGASKVSPSAGLTKKAASASPAGSYYTLSFTIVFPESAAGQKPDKFYLANCYPYTYSDLVGYLRRTLAAHEEVSNMASTAPTIQPVPPPAGGGGGSTTADTTIASPTSPKVPRPYPATTAAASPTRASAPTVPARCLFVQSLCTTLSGNACPVMTITTCENKVPGSKTTEPVSEEEMRQRPVVILTARVHPGESNASYMMKGVLDFLLDPKNRRAEQLRSAFVFKIIPMLNPDGVINGNHRCSLAGKDLNREYHNPGRYTYPTIYYLKAFVRHLKEVQGRNVVLYSDFHGHSRCSNFVIYGGGVGITPSVLLGGLLKPSLVSAMFPTGKAKEGPAPQPPSSPTNGGDSSGGDASGGGTSSAGSPLLSTNTTQQPQDQFSRLSLIRHHPFLQEGVLGGVTCEKLFPQVLQEHAPYFASGSCNYKIGKAKRNTGRGVFYRELGVRMSYTVEASMMGGMGCDFFPDAYDDLFSMVSSGSSDVCSASTESICREAARWSITNRQLSATPPSLGADGISYSSTTFCGHYNSRHYSTLGAMFAKSLSAMWSMFKSNGGVLDRSPYAAPVQQSLSPKTNFLTPRISTNGIPLPCPFDGRVESLAVGVGSITPMGDILGGLAKDAKEQLSKAQKASRKANLKKKRRQTAVTKKASVKPVGKKSTVARKAINSAPAGGRMSAGGGLQNTSSAQGSARPLGTVPRGDHSGRNATASSVAKATEDSFNSASDDIVFVGGRSPVVDLSPSSTTGFSGSYARSTRRGLEAPSKLLGPLRESNEGEDGGAIAQDVDDSMVSVQTAGGGDVNDGDNSGGSGADSGSEDSSGTGSCSADDEDDVDDADGGGLNAEPTSGGSTQTVVTQPYLTRVKRQRKLKIHQRISTHAPASQADVLAVLRAAFAQGPVIQRSMGGIVSKAPTPSLTSQSDTTSRPPIRPPTTASSSSASTTSKTGPGKTTIKKSTPSAISRR